MALDVGFKKIGVAVSDPLLLTARPYTIIYRKSNKETFEELLKIIDELKVEKVLIGIPINSQGEITKIGEKFKKFANKFSDYLKGIGKEIEIEFIDESYSTLEAKELYKTLGKEKKELDDVAAALLLKEWLEKKFEV
jgi:putative Holliday junction resolvase